MSPKKDWLDDTVLRMDDTVSIRRGQVELPFEVYKKEEERSVTLSLMKRARGPWYARAWRWLTTYDGAFGGRLARIQAEREKAEERDAMSCDLCGAHLSMGMTFSVQPGGKLACGHCVPLIVSAPSPSLPSIDLARLASSWPVGSSDEAIARVHGIDVAIVAAIRGHNSWSDAPRRSPGIASFGTWPSATTATGFLASSGAPLKTRWIASTGGE